MGVNLSDAQFAQLISSIGHRRSTLASCKASYNGTKNSETVEAFLTAVRVFKKIEQIADSDVIDGLPLLLHEEAAIWWQGVKEKVTSWAEFEEQLRYNFAPKKEEYLVYQDIISERQENAQPTDKFISKKRMLFSQLPIGEQLAEKQQIDLIYSLLHLNIRDKVPRNSIQTFDDLLRDARSAEQVIKEKKTGVIASTSGQRQTGKPKCNYCKIYGHVYEQCRKRKNNQLNNTTSTNTPTEAVEKPGKQEPTTINKLACYGCGAPGVYRSNCLTCNNQARTDKKLSFCSLNVQVETHSRPTVYIKVVGMHGTAFIDTCAKSNVASFQLYEKLQKRGYSFNEQAVYLTMADGFQRRENVLTFNADVELGGRKIDSNFIVLPQSKENRTLLGVGFLKKAGISLNLAQFTWNFVDNPGQEYELYLEDFTTFDHKTEISPRRAVRSPLAPKRCKESDPLSATLACEVTPTESQADLPDEAASTSYKLVPIDIATTPPHLKRFRTNIFDGYSPRLEYIMNDAIIHTSLDTDNNLSPSTNNLFSEPYVDLSSVNIETKLNKTQSVQLTDLLQEYTDIFISNGKPTSLTEHCIQTLDHPPISMPPYRLSPSRKEILKIELDKLLKDGIIEPCSSPWAAPVVMIPKPNGTIRLCVDYRRMNSITVPDIYPIPRIDDLLHEAKPTPFMSALDLKAGYWQIKVRDEDQEKTAFITPFGIFKFTRMPFGLRNAPATFQRLIDRFRVSLNHVKLLAYLDDLMVFSSGFEEHLSDLRDIFLKMREFNLTANREKCRFCCSSLKYLGHLITPAGLSMDPEKIEAITNLPVPSNLKHLVTFLQTCSWYRRFIKDFSKIAEPLTRLTKKTAKWVWTDEQNKAYNGLKNLLTTAPVLKQADFTKPYILKTDASNYALGAVLVQGEGKDEHPVEYASRLLTSAEINYNTTEKEALAVVWAITKFSGYIDGSPITVVTDHQALKWLMSLKSPTGRLARWALQLQAYNITIKYAPGRTNVVADTLSRPPCTDANKEYCSICSIVVDLPSRSARDVRDEQSKDDRIKRIIRALEDTENTENAYYWSSKGYFLNNGLLYRNNPNIENDDAQLVVPAHEWANVLATYHDSPLAGHYGSEKTYQAIAKRYFWTGMRKYIEGYIRNCADCQRYKVINQKPAGLLQTTTMNQRFEVLAFDLFGPLPVSVEGMAWVLIVEDLASRWVELFPLEAATAEKCALTLMNEIFLRFGFPRRMISDNGTQFVSAVMQQLAFCMKIKHAFTPVYHPETNPVERRNRDLKTQLAIILGDNHRNWPEQLPCIRFAMNSAQCSSTNITPAFLTFGRELKTLDDSWHNFRQIVISENFIPEITPKLLQLATTMEKAKEVHEMKEEKRKEYVDRTRRIDPGYDVGDLVMVTLHPISKSAQGISAKFAPRRDGPYKIKARHGPASYQISSIEDPYTSLGVYHTSALAPYSGRDDVVPLPVQPLKKKGRPKKIMTTVNVETHPKRGRGRPKKNTH